MPKAYKDISASQSARNQLNQSYQASGAAATQQIVRNTRYEQQAVQDDLNVITNDNIRNAQVFNWVNMGLNIAGQIQHRQPRPDRKGKHKKRGKAQHWL